MSVTEAMRSASSAMLAQSQAMARVSENVANVHTRGYQAARPGFSSLDDGGVEITIRASRQASDPNAASDTDLATEITDSIAIRNAFKAAVGVFKTADEMQDDLIEIVDRRRK